MNEIEKLYLNKSWEKNRFLRDSSCLMIWILQYIYMSSYLKYYIYWPNIKSKYTFGHKTLILQVSSHGIYVYTDTDTDTHTDTDTEIDIHTYILADKDTDTCIKSTLRLIYRNNSRYLIQCFFS